MLKCGRCGFENPPGQPVCGHCGQALAPAPGYLAADVLQRLRLYLPLPLAEALQADLAAPPARLLEQCFAHLAQLLDTTASHLPAFLVENVVRDLAPGRIGGQFLNGTLLFADISGFTAMSERLSRIGR